MEIDFLLIQKMRIGDETAIDTFVKKYYPAIVRFCQVHVHDAGYAEDIAQDTFVRFFQNLPQYQHYGKAANFLYAIATNLCNDFYRKSREIPLEELPEEGVCITDTVDEKLALQNAFSRLPAEIRTVAILYFVQECKQKDIARILGIGLPLTKYRISRARKLLSAYLGKESLCKEPIEK